MTILLGVSFFVLCICAEAHPKVETAKELAGWTSTTKTTNLTMPAVIFECEIELSEEVPTSVHKLRPSDINVIGAFGDSISAGYGVGSKTLPGVARNHRGEVFSIGGDNTLDDKVITLPNFLKMFNPNLKGYSEGYSQRINYKKSGLNVAKGGAVNTDMPNQARLFIELLKKDESIDFENDWKMVSLFVGGNDLCGSCRKEAYSPENYGLNFRKAVDLMFAQVPRLFVNLIVMFDVTPLANFSTGPLCTAMQKSYCDCAINEDTKNQTQQVQQSYYEELKKIADDVTYQAKDDFQVVLQPHMRDMKPPTDTETGLWVSGFLAQDCFHPNLVSHQIMAFYLWNDLLTPVNKKPLTSNTNTDYLSAPITAYCPKKKKVPTATLR